MTRGTALRLVVIMGLWAACFPLIKLGIGSAPHLAFASMRAGLAGAGLLALGGFLGRPWPVGKQTWVLLVLAGLGSTSLGFLGMFHAAEFLAPGLATMIANVQPLLAALLARIFLGERLGLKGGLGLAIGFAGIVLIASPGVLSAATKNDALGIAYIGLAATGVAIGSVMMKRLAGEVDALMAMGVQLLLGGVPLAVLSLFTDDFSAIIWSGNFVLVLVTLAMFVTALAFFLWFTVLEEVALSKANAFTFLLPVFGLAVGAFFFNEQLAWSAIGGGALIVTGIVFVQREDHDQHMRGPKLHSVDPDRL